MNTFLLVKRLGLDSLILIAAISCFVIYALEVNSIEKTITQGQSLGQIIEGQALRKSSGSPLFLEIVPRAPIYNRNVIWVTESAWAKIRFNDSSTLRIKQGSLVVINRSLVSSNLGARIDLLTGEIELEKHWLWPWESSDFDVISNGKKISTAHQSHLNVRSEDEPESSTSPTPSVFKVPEENTPSPAPSPSSSPTPEPSQLHTHPVPSAAPANGLDLSTIHPRMDSILLKARGEEAKVEFAWPTAVTGTLEVRTVSGQAAPQKVTLNGQTNARLNLKVEQTYEWQVNEGASQVLYGPYRFKVLSAKKHPLGKMIQDESKAVIEMTQ